ncbi:MAG: hypothetical protein JO112_07405 [Planctomycetes bacterium]|nr:hypothetical protein [Planctomycetota bacterium]
MRLPKSFIIELYCFSRQAERSVDAALLAPWSEFRAYYGPDKISALALLILKLQSLLPYPFPRSEEDITPTVVAPGLFKVLLGPWIARWKKKWTFSCQEIALLACTLQTLVNIVKKPLPPDLQFLIRLRMDFWTCEYIIESRCYGMRELKVAQNIEHFNQSWHIKPVTLSELVSNR